MSRRRTSAGPTRPAPAPPTEPRHGPGHPEPGGDLALLDHCLRTLDGYRFRPRRTVTYEDLLDIPVTGVVEFRRRPLTTLLMLRGLSGELIFPRVFVDDHDRSRTTFLDLKHFLREVAYQAGTAGDLGEIHFRPAAGSINSGVLRFILRDEIHEHRVNLDPWFGDQRLEDRLLASVTPPGHRMFNLLMGLGQQPVTLWLPDGVDDGGLLTSLDAENRHRASQWRRCVRG